jgi:hypothetical protein
MATTLFFVAAFCIVAVFVYMGRYSGRVRVVQRRVINAPIEQVYVQVSGFEHWQDWCPWLEGVSDSARSLSGVCNAKGGALRWHTEKASEGEVEHRLLVEDKRIEQHVRLKHPFSVGGRAIWTFTECDGKTEVTWSMQGRVAFSMRAFAATVNGALALDIRYGLDRLASLLEPADAPRYAITYEGAQEVAPCRYVYRTYSGAISRLSGEMPALLSSLKLQLGDIGVVPQGAPLAVYVKTNIKLRTTVCYLGYPIGDAEVGDLSVRELPAHRAFVVRLRGDYGVLELAWYLAMQRMTVEGLRADQRIAPFERYHVDAAAAIQNDYLTELHIALVTT